MHIFSTALIPVPFETITEQLKVLSALGRQKLQTGGRSEGAEPTEPPRQESQGRCSGSWASVALRKAQKPRGHHPNAKSCVSMLTMKLSPSLAILASPVVCMGLRADRGREPTQWVHQLLWTVTTQSRAHRQSLGDI